MTTKKQAVDNEFWTLRSLLRSKQVLDLELDKHLERVEILIKSFLPND